MSDKLSKEERNYAESLMNEAFEFGIDRAEDEGDTRHSINLEDVYAAFKKARKKPKELN